MLILCLNESDAKTHRRKTRPAERSWQERAIVDICAFDQEKGIPSSLSQASDLNPKSPSHQATVEIKNALSLDDSIASDVVITDPKWLYAN